METNKNRREFMTGAIATAAAATLPTIDTIAPALVPHPIYLWHVGLNKRASYRWVHAVDAGMFVNYPGCTAGGCND